jgi:hypothetical protein
MMLPDIDQAHSLNKSAAIRTRPKSAGRIKSSGYRINSSYLFWPTVTGRCTGSQLTKGVSIYELRDFPASGGVSWRFACSSGRQVRIRH